MSARLKYEIGHHLGGALHGNFGGTMGLLGLAADNRQWNGVGEFWPVWRFTIVLPQQSGPAVKLWQLLNEMADRPWKLGSMASRSRRALHAKLTLALGMPTKAWGPREAPYLLAVSEHPGELGCWMSYADWLQEQDEEPQVRRGQVIAGWLGARPVKVRSGVPLLARRRAQ